MSYIMTMGNELKHKSQHYNTTAEHKIVIKILTYISLSKKLDIKIKIALKKTKQIPSTLIRAGHKLCHPNIKSFWYYNSKKTLINFIFDVTLWFFHSATLQTHKWVVIIWSETVKDILLLWRGSFKQNSARYNICRQLFILSIFKLHIMHLFDQKPKKCQDIQNAWKYKSTSRCIQESLNRLRHVNTP